MSPIPQDAPQNLQQLITYVKDANHPCSCLKCSPELYLQCNSKQHPTTPLSKRSPPQQGDLYHAMHLVQHTISCITKPKSSMMLMQTTALKEYHTEFNDQKLGYTNGAKSVSNRKLERMVDIFNRIYFFGTTETEIIWRDLSSFSDPKRLAQYNHAIKVIEIDPKAKSYYIQDGDVSGLKVERTSVVLQEALHALLMQLTCSSCAGFDKHESHAIYHGWAFQLLASQLEAVFKDLLDMQLNLRGFDSLYGCWKWVQYLPSLHDMEAWGWIDHAGQPTGC